MATANEAVRSGELLQAVSDGLAALVTKAAAGVVRVEGGRRAPASGAVWSAEGVVVTAHHALERDEDLEVGLEGGETVPARIAGRDPAIDVAVLRLARGGLAPVPFAEGGAGAGQLLLALSRPGRGIRASLGVVARVGGEWRTPAGGRVDRWLEADVPLRPGFSGGLLLDAAGRALALAAGGLLRGHALGIPPETLRRSVESILVHGSVRRGFLGVATFPVRLPPAAEREAGQRSALLLTAVEAGSPADQAGLTVGDALLTVEGAPVTHAGELLALLEPERIGQPLRLRVWRPGGTREVTAVVGARERERP